MEVSVKEKGQGESRCEREVLGRRRPLAWAETPHGALKAADVARGGVGGCAVACKGDRRLKLELEDFCSSSARVSVSSLQRLEAGAESGGRGSVRLRGEGKERGYGCQQSGKLTASRATIARRPLACVTRCVIRPTILPSKRQLSMQGYLILEHLTESKFSGRHFVVQYHASFERLVARISIRHKITEQPGTERPIEKGVGRPELTSPA